MGLMSPSAEYRERMRLDHGWEVEVACPGCGRVAVPDFRGWTPSQVIRFGDRPTIYADLACVRCGAELKEAAGQRLVELFAGVPVSRENRRALAIFLAMILAPMLAGFGLFFAQRALGLAPIWREVGTFLGRSPLLMLWPMIYWFNARVHAARHRCPCGRPAYKLMGLLGRSYCLRCSSCGRALRLRD